MKKEITEKPVASPKVVARRAEKMPWKENARVDVFPYQKAILALRERGYSFGEIADWLGKEINAPVKRGQIYYVYQMHLAEQDQEFEEARASGKLKELPSLKLSEDEAEKRASEMDGKKKQ